MNKSIVYCRYLNTKPLRNEIFCKFVITQQRRLLEKRVRKGFCFWRFWSLLKWPLCFTSGNSLSTFIWFIKNKQSPRWFWTFMIKKNKMNWGTLDYEKVGFAIEKPQYLLKNSTFYNNWCKAFFGCFKTIYS